MMSAGGKQREAEVILKEGPHLVPAPVHWMHWKRTREPRPLDAAGVRRRVIEGEGLGGFARRHQVNAGGVIGFRGGLRFFCRRPRIGFWLEIAQDSQGGEEPERAARRWIG